jgi:hypothetical protein
MAIGTLATAVPSSNESNPTVPQTVKDDQTRVDDRLVVLEHKAAAELGMQIRYLYDQLNIEFPGGTYLYPPG